MAAGKSKRKPIRRKSARQAKSPKGRKIRIESRLGKIRIESRHDLFPVELLDQQFQRVMRGYGSIMRRWLPELT